MFRLFVKREELNPFLDGGTSQVRIKVLVWIVTFTLSSQGSQALETIRMMREGAEQWREQ